MVFLFSCTKETTHTDTNPAETKTPGSTEFINPESLSKNPAFSQLAVIKGNNKTIYIGGQDAIDSAGHIVGKGNIEQQAQQVLKNLEAALKAGGAGFQHVVKWNIYFVKGQSPEKALKVFGPQMSKLKAPPLVTGVFVESLANPDYLLEIEAIAVVPE